LNGKKSKKIKKIVRFRNPPSSFLLFCFFLLGSGPFPGLSRQEELLFFFFFFFFSFFFFLNPWPTKKAL
jgi:hypothetical protein